MIQFFLGINSFFSSRKINDNFFFIPIIIGFFFRTNLDVFVRQSPLVYNESREPSISMKSCTKIGFVCHGTWHSDSWVGVFRAENFQL